MILGYDQTYWSVVADLAQAADFAVGKPDTEHKQRLHAKLLDLYLEATRTVTCPACRLVHHVTATCQHPLSFGD